MEQSAFFEGDWDTISYARAPLAADRYLYGHLREGVKGPECSFRNACYARANSMPAH